MSVRPKNFTKKFDKRLAAWYSMAMGTDTQTKTVYEHGVLDGIPAIYEVEKTKDGKALSIVVYVQVVPEPKLGADQSSPQQNV